MTAPTTLECSTHAGCSFTTSFTTTTHTAAMPVHLSAVVQLHFHIVLGGSLQNPLSMWAPGTFLVRAMLSITPILMHLNKQIR